MLSTAADFLLYSILYLSAIFSALAHGVSPPIMHVRMWPTVMKVLVVLVLAAILALYYPIRVHILKSETWCVSLFAWVCWLCIVLQDSILHLCPSVQQSSQVYQMGACSLSNRTNQMGEIVVTRLSALKIASPTYYYSTTTTYTGCDECLEYVYVRTYFGMLAPPSALMPVSH